MSAKPAVWKRIESKKVADCRVFSVREDKSVKSDENLQGTFYVIENPDWVNIIALTKENEVVLIEQFRHGAEKVILEIPGGMIDAGEMPEASARRELLEETGFDSENWILLGNSSPNPAIQNNTVFHYLALDCRKIRETAFDEHENIVTKLVSFEKISDLILRGEITHSLVIAAFYFFSIYRTGAK